jgi:hypothetical protein
MVHAADPLPISQQIPCDAWATKMPQDVLGLIYGNMSANSGRFACVCRRWHAAAKSKVLTDCRRIFVLFKDYVSQNVSETLDALKETPPSLQNLKFICHVLLQSVAVRLREVRVSGNVALNDPRLLGCGVSSIEQWNRIYATQEVGVGRILGLLHKKHIPLALSLLPACDRRKKENIRQEVQGFLESQGFASQALEVPVYFGVSQIRFPALIEKNIMSLYAKVKGKMSDVVAAVEGMEGVLAKEWAWKAIVKLSMREKDFKSALNMCSKIHDSVILSETLQYVVLRLLVAGEKQLAFETVTKIPCEEDLSSVIFFIVDGFLSCGKEEDVVGIAKYISTVPSQGSVLQGIAKKVARDHEKEAHDIANMITNPDVRASTLHDIGLLRASKISKESYQSDLLSLPCGVDDTSSFYWLLCGNAKKAVDVALAYKDEKKRYHTLCELANWLSDVGEFEKFSKIVAESSSQNLNYIFPQEVMRLAQNGSFAMAFQKAKASDDPQSMSVRVLEDSIRAGKVQEAFDEAMKLPLDRHDVLTVYSALLETNNVDKAFLLSSKFPKYFPGEQKIYASLLYGKTEAAQALLQDAESEQQNQYRTAMNEFLIASEGVLSAIKHLAKSQEEPKKTFQAGYTH